MEWLQLKGFASPQWEKLSHSIFMFHSGDCQSVTSEHKVLKCCEQTENRMWEENVLQPETGIITVSCTQRCSLTALLLIKSQEVSDVLFDSPAHASDTALGTAGKTGESLCFLARVSSQEDNDSNLRWPRPVIPCHPSFSIFHLQFRQKQEKKPQNSGM